jgi:uncharacterized protein with HEPN domain
VNEKDPKVFISHILDCIQKIKEYLEGKSKEDFMNSTQLQDAVIRRIEIIGEASRNIPSEIQEEYSHVHWEEAKGMRNILIHEYFGVDLELTWQVVKQDLPKLREQMLALKEELTEESDSR